MVKATWNGAVLAESDQTIMVEGNHYFPPNSIHAEYFVQVDGKTNSNAAWYYPAPQPAAEKIAGYVAFWHGVRVREE